MPDDYLQVGALLLITVQFVHNRLFDSSKRGKKPGSPACENTQQGKGAAAEGGLKERWRSFTIFSKKHNKIGTEPNEQV
jgi:hypothetical protein